MHNGALPLCLSPGFNTDPISCETLWLETLLFKRSAFHWLPVYLSTWLANQAKQQCVLTPSIILLIKKVDVIYVMSTRCQSQFNWPAGGLYNKSCMGRDQLSVQPIWKTPVYTPVPFQNKTNNPLVQKAKQTAGHWTFTGGFKVWSPKVYWYSQGLVTEH